MSTIWKGLIVVATAGCTALCGICIARKIISRIVRNYEADDNTPNVYLFTSENNPVATISSSILPVCTRNHTGLYRLIAIDGQCSLCYKETEKNDINTIEVLASMKKECEV